MSETANRYEPNESCQTNISERSVCPRIPYSFKLDNGTVYTAQTHKTLDVTLNGHTKFRLEKDGHVGDYVHILDDAGKDRKLRIIKKEIQPQTSTK